MQAVDADPAGVGHVAGRHAVHAGAVRRGKLRGRHPARVRLRRRAQRRRRRASNANVNAKSKSPVGAARRTVPNCHRRDQRVAPRVVHPRRALRPDRVRVRGVVRVPVPVLTRLRRGWVRPRVLPPERAIRPRPGPAPVHRSTDADDVRAATDEDAPGRASRAREGDARRVRRDDVGVLRQRRHDRAERVVGPLRGARFVPRVVRHQPLRRHRRRRGRQRVRRVLRAFGDDGGGVGGRERVGWGPGHGWPV